MRIGDELKDRVFFQESHKQTIGQRFFTSEGAHAVCSDMLSGKPSGDGAIRCATPHEFFVVFIPFGVFPLVRRQRGESDRRIRSLYASLKAAPDCRPKVSPAHVVTRSGAPAGVKKR